MENNLTLFDIGEGNNWQDEWKDMPEYNNTEQGKPLITVLFKFATQEDYDRFYAIVRDCLFDGEKPFDGMQRKTEKSAWWPPKERASKYIYTDES